MAALATNILVRCIVEDDASQLAAARKPIPRCANEKESLYVPVTVSRELEWVLRSNFGFSKEAVIDTLSELHSSRELTFESEGALEVALTLYSRGGADYSDCLHVALAYVAGEQPMWTFDKAAAKLEGARLL